MNHFKIQQSVEVDRVFSYEIWHNLMNIKIIWQELFCWALHSLSQDQINTFSVKENKSAKTTGIFLQENVIFYMANSIILQQYRQTF